MLRFLTAGESHGKALVAILEGMPAGLKVDSARIDQELKRRQGGIGRGKRMQMERDKARIISGLKKGITLGSPIALCIENKDFSIERLSKVTCPRPGHADLAGLLKYGFTDVRNVLERASARETASRVGIGAICKIFLEVFKIRISSRVLSIGGESSHSGIIKKINQAKSNKDTLGGIFEVIAKGVPCGLGSYVQADRRLDGRIAQAIMSIPAIKAVGIGFLLHRCAIQVKLKLSFSPDLNHGRRLVLRCDVIQQFGLLGGKGVFRSHAPYPGYIVAQPPGVDALHVRRRHAHPLPGHIPGHLKAAIAEDGGIHLGDYALPILTLDFKHLTIFKDSLSPSS